MGMGARIVLTSMLSAALALTWFGANAQAVDGFYKGRSLTIYIGFSSAGGYDIYSRAVGRHIAKHLPGNPNVIPQNMPGAGSLKATNYLYNVAPKDGTALGVFSRGAPFEPLLGNAAAQFDASKFNWIGSPSQETNVVFAWHTKPFNSFDDVTKREMTVASTGLGADTATFPLLLNEVFKTKFKIVTGYPGAAETYLAVERGEVDGIGGISWGPTKVSKPDWVKEKKIKVLLQMAFEKREDIPDVPLIMDVISNDADKQLLELFLARLVMAWPFAAPPGVPLDRVTILREAFDRTMSDTAFLADARKQELEVRPVKGAAIERLVERVYASPKEVVARGRLINDARQ